MATRFLKLILLAFDLKNIYMETKKKVVKPNEMPVTEKHLKIIPPVDPEELVVPDEDPEMIPDDDPFANPPYDEPVAGEGP
jgi:hypothetical protein